VNHQRILPRHGLVDSILRYSKAANSTGILDKPTTLRARGGTEASPYHRHLAASAVLSIQLYPGLGKLVDRSKSQRFAHWEDLNTSPWLQSEGVGGNPHRGRC
jgi:hypothetical protein